MHFKEGKKWLANIPFSDLHENRIRRAFGTHENKFGVPSLDDILCSLDSLM